MSAWLKKNKLTVFGVAVTGIYALVLWGVLGAKLWDFEWLALNEAGDFLAGVFGPLTLFWLILGFIQQGYELGQNSRALRMQADELKNSVEQQQRLVEVARNEYVAGNRPWLYVDAEIATQTRGHGHQPQFMVRYTLSNSGNSPALGVWLAVKPIAHNLGKAAWEEQRDFCDDIRSTYAALLVEQSKQPRIAVFPGRDHVRTEGLSFGEGELEAGIAITGSWTQSLLVGCVTYQSSVSDAIHQSRFIFQFTQGPNSVVRWTDPHPVGLSRYFVGDEAD